MLISFFKEENCERNEVEYSFVQAQSVESCGELLLFSKESEERTRGGQKIHITGT